MALDIAGWRHRHVHACEVVMRLLGLAGVVVHLGTDVFRQVIGGHRWKPQECDAPSPGRTLATGIDDWQIHGSSSLKVTT
jgi:hypothetical protein